MLDIKWILANSEAFDSTMELRKCAIRAHEIRSLHESKLALEREIQDLRTEQNTLSQAIGQLKRDHQPLGHLLVRGEEIKHALNDLNQRVSPGIELNKILLSLPNLFDSTVPVGKDEHDNVRIGGSTHTNLKTGPQHFELTDLMDFESAGRIHGSRFVILKGELARLERAIGQFMLDSQIDMGFTEVSVPVLVNTEALIGTGQLPKFEEDLYKVGDKWLIPTAEVPLTNLAANTIAKSGDTQRYTALTNCFRSEAGASGKDVRGMLRQHQFNKVELVSIVTEELAHQEHQFVLACALRVLSELDIPNRVMKLCTGDTGFASKLTYDIEAWLPGQNAYREISSVSWCGDFQARRMNARYRDEQGVRFFHTINGSGLAVGRTLIALLENHTEDGLLHVPKPLQPYLRNNETIRLTDDR